MKPALGHSALVDAAGVPHVPVSDDTTPRIVSLVLAGDVRHLLLSSAPDLSAGATAELRRTAPSHVNVTLMDAEMTSWYGSRASAGLRYMAELRRALATVGTV